MLKIAVTGALALLCFGAAQGARSEEAGPFKPAQRAGYFFVGGRYEKLGGQGPRHRADVRRSSTPRPRSRSPIPVVMVHGTAQTGVNFLGTPDGRPGWVDRFVEQGFAVYVVDQVGRGRSGDNPEVYGPYARLAPATWRRIFTGQEKSPTCSRRPSSTPNGRAAPA